MYYIVADPGCIAITTSAERGPSGICDILKYALDAKTMFAVDIS